MLLVRLTQGQETWVSFQDDWVLELRWYAVRRGNKFYAARSVTENGKKRMVYLHRAVMERALGHGLPSNVVVDHADGDTLNNSRANLRACDHAANSQNRPGQPRSSRYKGVYRTRSRHRPWRVQINAEGRTRSLRGFRTEVLAALAYDALALDAYGAFAHLNFPHLFREFRELDPSLQE